MSFEAELEPRVMDAKERRKERRRLNRLQRMAKNYRNGKGFVIRSAEGVRFAYAGTPLPEKEQAVEPQHSPFQRTLRRLLNPNFKEQASIQVPKSDLEIPDYGDASQEGHTISDSRGEFIEEVYPKLFGEEEMGDPAREFEPAEITAILVAYEAKLATDGLLIVRAPRRGVQD